MFVLLRFLLKSSSMICDVCVLLCFVFQRQEMHLLPMQLPQGRLFITISSSDSILRIGR